jgi:hypothetical protein
VAAFFVAYVEPRFGYGNKGVAFDWDEPLALRRLVAYHPPAASTTTTATAMATHGSDGPGGALGASSAG